jgi:hypothetical protein
MQHVINVMNEDQHPATTTRRLGRRAGGPSQARHVKWLCSFLIASGSFLSAQSTSIRLQREFADPPNSARPRVWWHWMNGNITKPGIKLDLEWMHRVGLGGVTVFEGSIDTPQVVPKRLVYMTAEWKDAFHFAAETANRLGLEMTIASSAGWSATGGPWVPASEGMKKMVWSETQVEGGTRFSGTLPLPPKVSGPFQDVALHPKAKSPNEYYADSAVIAYLRPEDDRDQSDLHPVITSTGALSDPLSLADGVTGRTALALPYATSSSESWILFTYPKQQTVQALTLATTDDVGSIFGSAVLESNLPRIQASEDGITYRTLALIGPSSIPERTVSFAAVKARYFRVLFPAITTSSQIHTVSELVLHPASRVNAFEQQAGFATALDYYGIATPPVTLGSAVPLKNVVDLTTAMEPDGRLNWLVPAGRWTVLRIGYSLTGHENGPAPAEATGLEVDKLNPHFVNNYIEHYLNSYANTVGSDLIGSQGISHLLNDSVEVGSQNWTDDILSQFQRLRGYDAHPWLPALTGVIVTSPQQTTLFLWDFRRTIAELFAQNHYGEIATALHKRGLKYYVEALEYHRPSLGDDMEMRRYADIPMGAMWTFNPGEEPPSNYIADVRGAASVAHVYGQNLVGAESMTSNGPAWGWSPAMLKPVADYELALGVNRFMIHESAHQPLVDKAPGLTLGPYGLWFNRNETWARQAKPWVDYLARSSYLLQQGRFFADVAYFYGEEAPLTAIYANHPQTDAPQGYAFDYVNADVLLHQFKVVDGRLSTPGGASYRVLYLGGSSSHMTLPVLRRLRELVNQGAVIIGNKPQSSPSLADNPQEFDSIADELWHTSVSPSQHGLGLVYSGQRVGQILSDLGLQPDFSYTHPQTETSLLFLHRKLSRGDIYFVDHRNNRPEHIDISFHVSGRSPELWHADTGKTEPVSYTTKGDMTVVPLDLAAQEAVFVVFLKPTSARSRQIPSRHEKELISINSGWIATFQAGRGVAAPVLFDPLSSWSTNESAAVKYFSGTADYRRTISISAASLYSGQKLFLDLGGVRDVAEVTVNGKTIATLWKAPYRVDVTDALHAGRNQISIQVTNLWVNRLIGDQQPGATTHYAFTTFKPYTADSPLLPSGLLGPVKIVASKSRLGASQ